MDVPKAKVIVIVLLAAFNIFLLASNLTHVKGQNTETIANTLTILKQRGVTLECDIPKEIQTFHRLRYGSEKLDRASIVKKFFGEKYVMPVKGDVYVNNGKTIGFSGDMSFVYTDVAPSEGFDLGNEDKLKKNVQSFLKEKGLIDKSYIIDQFERNRDGSFGIYLIEKYENFLLYDNYCKVTLTNKGITKIEYSKYQVIGFSGEKIVRPQAYQALLAYYRDGADKIITGLDCGYSLENFTVDGMESVEVLPMWRAKLKDGSGPDFLDIDNTSAKEAQ